MKTRPSIRPWVAADFLSVQELSREEGWTTPMERPEDALVAWSNSRPALVAEVSGSIIGFVRGISDGRVTTYIAEILVHPEWRGQGLGREMLHAVQRLYPGTRLDLLSTSESGAFYEREGFRRFDGYRRSWAELDD